MTEENSSEIKVPDRNAAHYVIQETSAEIPAYMGEVPPGRFTEEVLKGSEEDKGEGVEAHPEENQPPMGIAPGDELPDTTGRQL